VNNLPKVVAQQRRGRASNPRLLDRKSDELPLSHRATINGRLLMLLDGLECYRDTQIKVYDITKLITEMKTSDSVQYRNNIIYKF